VHILRLAASALFLTSSVLSSSVADAGGLKRAERKALEAEATAVYEGKTVWALRDLPVKTGMTMGLPWVGPLVEVSPSGWKTEATAIVSSTMASAHTTWFGVRPYEKLALKEAIYDDDVLTITFVGTGASRGRDTKIDCLEVTAFSDVSAVLDELVTTTDPVDAGWPDDIKKAIVGRQLVNGMTKRQAYLVVGEPSGSSTRTEDGKKIEIWNPRPNNGMRIGFGMALEATGFPTEMRFEDGALTGIATSSGGGVSLD